MSMVPRLSIDTNYNVDQNSANDESFRGDYSGGLNLIYKGFAAPGTDESQAQWQIAKCAYDGNNNIISIKWPAQNNNVPNALGTGSNDYIFTWANRTTYTYL